MMIRKVINRLRNAMWQSNRGRINQRNRKRLKNKEVTILSSNCTGGILSHDLGLQFRSPTVNLYMKCDDFVRFCENLDYYLNKDFEECRDPEIIEDRTYPIGYLDDLTVYFVHYRSFEEAVQKWNERKKRIRWDNIFILHTDREGCSEEMKDRFEKLPYPKVLFTHLPNEKHPSCFYLKGYEEQDCVGIITDHNTMDGKRPVDQFDYVAWLNGKTRREG